MKYVIYLLIATAIVFTGCDSNTAQNSETTQNEDVNKVVDMTEQTQPEEWGNTHCPVMEGEVEEDGGQTVYQGKIVRFCCPKCIKKFTDNPEKYMETLAKYTPEKK